MMHISSLFPLNFSIHLGVAIITACWYTYPSEKYEFVNWDDEVPKIWTINMFQTTKQGLYPSITGLLWLTKPPLLATFMAKSLSTTCPSKAAAKVREASGPPSYGKILIFNRIYQVDHQKISWENRHVL